MLDTALLSSIATQLMNAPEVDVDGHKLSIARTSLHRFKTGNIHHERTRVHGD